MKLKTYSWGAAKRPSFIMNLPAVLQMAAAKDQFLFYADTMKHMFFMPF